MKSDRPVRSKGSESKVVEGPSHLGRYIMSTGNCNIQADLLTGSSRQYGANIMGYILMCAAELRKKLSICPQYGTLKTAHLQEEFGI